MMIWRGYALGLASLVCVGCAAKDDEPAGDGTGDGADDGEDGADDGSDDGGSDDGSGDGGDGDTPPGGEGPYRDAWVTEIEGDYPYIGDNIIAITSVSIGGTEFDNNFANRGDVIVRFDNDPDRITVEMRRFAWADSEDAARAEFAKLRLWAYNTSVASPKPPEQMDAATQCTSDGWQEGCGIRVYYEGQIQPARTGADFRVTLPVDYRHNVNVQTSDLDDPDYSNPGDVCIEGLNGSADVALESGLVFVTLDDAITPGPTCPAADIEACETWDTGAWSPECPCAVLGRVRVESTARPSSIAIDSPSGLWTSMTLDNQGEGQDPAGQHCTASIDWATSDVDIEQDPAAPWSVRGEANHPAGGIQGAGYNIRGVSAACAPVQHTDNPGDYVGPGNGDQQDAELRGDVTVCNDCLRQSSCEDLLPGA